METMQLNITAAHSIARIHSTVIVLVIKKLIISVGQSAESLDSEFSFYSMNDLMNWPLV